MDPYYLVVCEKTTDQEDKEPHIQRITKSEVLSQKPLNTTDSSLKADQHVLYPGSVSYADVAAGRTSPCAFDKNKDYYCPLPTSQVPKSDFSTIHFSNNNESFDSLHPKKGPSSLGEGEKRDSLIENSRVSEIPVTCAVEIIEPRVETPIALHKTYHPWPKSEQNSQNSLESDVLSQAMERQFLETESFHCQQQRHVWVPGSLTYADILRGRHGSSSDLSDNQRLSADSPEIVDKCMDQSRETKQSNRYEDLAISDGMPSSLPSQPFLPSIVSILSSAEHPISVDDVNKTQHFQEKAHYKPEVGVNMYESVHQQSSLTPDLIGLIPSSEDFLSSSHEVFEASVHQYPEESSETLVPTEPNHSNKSAILNEMKPDTKLYLSQHNTAQQPETLWKNEPFLESSHEQNAESSVAAVDPSFNTQQSEKETIECFSVTGSEESDKVPSTMPKGFLDAYQNDTSKVHHLSYAQILAHGLHNKHLNNPPVSHYSSDGSKRSEVQFLINQTEKDFTHFPDPEESDTGTNRPFPIETTHTISIQDIRRNMDILNKNKHFEDAIIPSDKARKYKYDTEGHKVKEDKMDIVISHPELTLPHTIHASYTSEKKQSTPVSYEESKLEMKENNEMKTQELLPTYTSSIEGEIDDPMKFNNQESSCNILVASNSIRKKKSKKKKKKKITFPDDKTLIEDEKVDQENDVEIEDESKNRLILLEKPESVNVYSEQIGNSGIMDSSQAHEEQQTNGRDFSSYNYYLQSLDSMSPSTPPTKFQKVETINWATLTSGKPMCQSELVMLPSSANPGTVSEISFEMESHMPRHSKTDDVNKAEVTVSHDDRLAMKEELDISPPTSTTKSCENVIVALPSPLTIEENKERKKRKKKSKKKGGNVDENWETSFHSTDSVSASKLEGTQFSVNDTDSSVIEEIFVHETGFSQFTLDSERASEKKGREEFSDTLSCASSIVDLRTRDCNIDETREKSELLQSQDKSEFHHENELSVKIESKKTEGKDAKDEVSRRKATRKKTNKKHKDSQQASMLLLTEDEKINLTDVPENHKQSIDSKSEKNERKALENVPDYEVSEPITQSNRSDHSDLEIPSVIEIKTNIETESPSQVSVQPLPEDEMAHNFKSSSEEISLHQVTSTEENPQVCNIANTTVLENFNKSERNVHYTTINDSVKSRYEGDIKNDSYSELSDPILNVKSDVFYKIPQDLESSSLDLIDAKLDDTRNLEDNSIDQSQKDFSSKLTHTDDLKKEAGEPSSQKRKRKFDKNLNSEDIRTVIYEPDQSVISLITESTGLKDPVDSGVTSTKDGANENLILQDVSVPLVPLPVGEKEVENMKFLTAVSDISPEPDNLNLFQKESTQENELRDTHKEINPDNRIIDQACDTQFIYKNEGINEEISLQTEISSLHFQITDRGNMPSLSSESIMYDYSQPTDAFMDNNTMEEVNKVYVAEKSLVVKEETPSICSPLYDHSSEVTHHLLEEKKEFAEMKFDVCSTNGERDKDSNISLPLTLPATNIVEHQLLFRDSNQTEDKNVLATIPDRHEVINSECDSSEELRNKHDLELKALNFDENRLLIPQQFEMSDISFSTTNLIEEPHSVDNIHIATYKISDANHENESENATQRHAVQYSLVREVRPYYLYTDAERNWYILQQKEQVIKTQKLLEDDGQKHVAPSTSESELAEVISNPYNIRTDELLEDTEEMKPKAIVDYYYTMELPRYAMSSLLDSERRWKELTALNSISNHGSEHPDTARNMETTQFNDQIFPDQLTNQEAYSTHPVNKSENKREDNLQLSLTSYLLADSSLPKYPVSVLLDAEQNWKETTANNLITHSEDVHLSHENVEEPSHTSQDHAKNQESCLLFQDAQSPMERNDTKSEEFQNYLLLDNSFPKYNTSALSDAEQNWKETVTFDLTSHEDEHLSHENIDESNETFHDCATSKDTEPSLQDPQSQMDRKDAKYHVFENHLLLDKSFPKFNTSALFEAERNWKETAVSLIPHEDDRLSQENISESSDTYQDHGMSKDTQPPLQDTETQLEMKDTDPLVFENHLRLDDAFPKYDTNALLDAEQNWKETTAFNLASCDTGKYLAHENIGESSDTFYDHPMDQESQSQTEIEDTKHLVLEKNLLLDDSHPKNNTDVVNAEQNWKVTTVFNLASHDTDVHLSREKISASGDIFQDMEPSLQDSQIQLEVKDPKHFVCDNHLLLDDSFPQYNTTALFDAERNWKELTSDTEYQGENKQSSSEGSTEINDSCIVDNLQAQMSQELQLHSVPLKDSQSKSEIEDISCHMLASHLLDDSFWTNKWCFDDAECKWQEQHARSVLRSKLQAVPTTPYEAFCSGYIDQDGDHGNQNIPGAPGVVEWQTEDDGVHLITKKALASGDLDALQSSLKDCEMRLTSLSSDSLRNMYDDILTICDALKSIDVKAQTLEETIQQLPTDQDVQNLNVATSNLRRRVTTLLSYTSEGCSTIERIQAQQELQLQNIAHYEELLNEIASWCSAATVTLNIDLQNLSHQQLLEQRDVFETISQELDQHDKKLKELMMSNDMQTHAGCLQLGTSLHQQLLSVRNLLMDMDVQVTNQITVTKEPEKIKEAETVEMKEEKPSSYQKLHSIQEQESHPASIPGARPIPEKSPEVVEKQPQVEDVEPPVLSPHGLVVSVHDERDNTIDSNASPIADEEVSLQSIEEEQEPVVKKIQEDKIAFHVASQTGDSLREPPPSILPVCTKDVAVEFHQPVDSQVQTMALTTTSAQMTENIPYEQHREKIKILKKFDDHEEVVEIATGHPSECLDISAVEGDRHKEIFDDNDDNLMVEVKFKGIKSKEKPTLQLVRDPDEMSTEVIVEAERRKRIVLKTSHSGGTEVHVIDDKHLSKDQPPPKDKPSEISPEVKFTMPEKDTSKQKELSDPQDMDLKLSGRETVELDSSPEKGTIEEYQFQSTTDEPLTGSIDEKLDVKEKDLPEYVPEEEKQEKIVHMGIGLAVTEISSTCLNISDVPAENSYIKESEITVSEKSEGKPDSSDDVMKLSSLQVINDHDIEPSEDEKLLQAGSQSSFSGSPHTKDTDIADEPGTPENVSEEHPDDEYPELTQAKESTALPDIDDLSVETSLAESTEIIVSTEGDKNSSDTTKPTELEIVFLDTSCVQSPMEFDSTHSQETGYDPEDISSEVSIPEKKKKRRKKRTKQMSDVPQTVKEPQVQDDIHELTTMTSPRLESIITTDKEEIVQTDYQQALQPTTDTVAAKDTEDPGEETVLTNDENEHLIEKDNLEEIMGQTDAAEEHNKILDICLHSEVVPQIVMTDSSVQATVSVAVETVQTISPEPSPKEIQSNDFISAVALSEIDTQTSPAPETFDTGMQTLSPEFKTQDFQTCATQVSSPESVPEKQESEITHSATQVTTETEEGYMQTSPIEQIISDVADVSLQTVIDTNETLDSFVQTSPVPEVPVPTNIQPEDSIDVLEEKISPELQDHLAYIEKTEEVPLAIGGVTVSPVTETVHSSMQTTDMPTISCESQTSPDGFKDTERMPTATVSMQTISETVISADSYMQTSPMDSFEMETINASIQTETSNTGNISTQADIVLPSEGITVDIQTNKDELTPSVEMSMQTDIAKLPVTETIDTISQTIQSGSGTMPGSDSCIQTTVSELIPSVEGSTQTNLQASTFIDSSVQTNKEALTSEQPLHPESVTSPKEPQTEREKDADKQERNESSSEEQLEVNIQASIVFPTERTTLVAQKTVSKQSSPAPQDDRETTHADKSLKKRHKKKSKRNDKGSANKKSETTEKLSVADVERFVDISIPSLGSEINDFKPQPSEQVPDKKDFLTPKRTVDDDAEEIISKSLDGKDPYNQVHIHDDTKFENASEGFERQDVQELVMSLHDNEEISLKEDKPIVIEADNIVYKIEDSIVASVPDSVEKGEDIPLKVEPHSTNIDDDIEKVDLIIETQSTKNGNEINVQVPETLPDNVSRNFEIIPSEQSTEKSDLITAEECYRREICYPKENEWKQMQCLVADRVRKLQKERHTTHLSGVLYLATLQQIVADESFEQKNSAFQHDIITLREAIDSKNKAVIQRSVITIVETVSTWLESIEYHVLLNCQLRTAPTKDHITELGNLKQEIINVGENVEGLDSVMENVYTMFDGDDASNMKQCISSLQNQVEAMKEVTDEKEQQATKDLNRWEEFLNGVNNVSVLIEELKEHLDQLVETDLYVHRKLELLDHIESTNHSHQQKTIQLMNNAWALLCDFPGHEIPPELYSAYETTRSIEHSVKLERDRQLQLIALADEYEQTLKEFAQIVDVADALVESSIVVSSLEHLQEEMQKHRKFFVNLSHCRCILESLEGNLDTETRNKHSGLHQQLHTRASGILDKAAGRAQQMALAASRWTVLEQGMKEERNWLQVAHQRVPDLQSVTSSEYDQYISLYQSLSADVAVHHGHCAQLIEVARRLQELVLCPGLEARYDEHLEVIAKLQEDINKNLHCLLSFRDTWRNYVTLTEKLCQWMIYAEKELANISSEDQHPGTNMKHFWELKAQYEVHNNIRNEASSNFNAAMKIIPVADENLQCQLHAKLEERWWNVSSQIQNIQTAILEILSNQEVPVKDKLAALQQELQELQSALNDTHRVIKKEEELELYIQRMQVMLGGVEHIQEELSRLGLLSVDETEKVGILLCGAGNIELQIKEELEGAIMLREKINAIQKGLNRIRRSYERASNVLDQCEKGVNQGQDAVEQALRNCQGVCDELTTLWQDVMDLRQLLHTLPMSLHLSISPVHLERNISQVQDHHTALESRSAHLLSLLKNRLTMWQHFEQQLELVQQSVQETDYMMELLTVQGSVDYDRLVKATECLEGLYGSLDQREDLLDELRVAAAPLAESCAPEVSAKIKVAVEDVERSWNNTRQTLRELCERYQDAARLWRQYREASDCVKTWAEQQLDSTAHLTPAEALRHVKVCEETLEAHQARLGDLRGLVARIAADVGLDAGGPLDDDVAALGRRLEDVRESLAALAEVAEAQQIGQNELQSTCNFLASVKQSLSMVEEANEKDIENQLSALRNHLLALGKTEGQLQTFKERPIDLSPSKSETSVVEILQLWQQVFRETFQHYHRLSARLVKSQDSAAALRLWHEYLLHVQSFLSSSIPEDYRGLTEHQHLCEVHQNLLMSQQSVLLSQNEGRTHQDGVELSVIEQFNSLTNLHNETLARIMERHSEVGERLVSWEKYSQEQARLLTWLRDLERERSRLQLHNIHIRRIPKVLSHIQTMLEKEVPLGESQALELLELQNNLFHNTDDTVASSVRLAYATITQRISNLKAALETWKDHLDRINSLVSTYEKNATNVQTVFQEIHSAICESQALISHADVRNRLDSLRNLRSRILVLTSDLETMNVTLEQLRECLSPMDMKTLNQRTWLLWQSHNDLDHQLAVLCHHLEERINLFTLFDTRRSRFLVWVEDMVLRLDQICVGDPEEVLSRIQTDIQGDIALKSREVDWLLSTGHELIAAASGDDENSTTEQNDLQKKLSEVHRCWEELQNLAANKVNKLQNILQNLSHLEQQLSELRKWCHQIETQLMKPLVITECTQEVYAERLQEIEDLQNTIEHQSGKVGEILNVSELLLSDYELVKTTVNTESISIATDAIEKRWKHICEVSTERKRNFMNTWKLLKNLLNGCREKQRWIEIQEDILENIQRKINQISPSELQDYLSQVEGVLEELQSQKQRLVVLDHSYSQFVKSCRMVPDNLSPTTSLIHVTLQRWHALIPMATALADLLCQELKMYRDFVNIHGKAVMNLTELDIRLTQLQHLHSPDGASSSSMSREIVEQLERELRALNSLLQTADSLGMTLLQKCKEEDQSSIQVMMDEYQLLRRDITIRLATLKAEYLSEREGGASLIKERDESIQVETLRFEQDSAIQVNTLPHLAEIAPQSRGFDTAIAECKSNLATLKDVLEESPTDGSKLATALAGSQSSIELVRHLSSRLGEKGGVSEEQRRTQEVTALNTEYERLCSLACVQHQSTGESSENARLTCPLCSQFNWQQLDNDLWRLEQWLQFSEGTQSNYQVPPSDIEQLEDTIQDHREFLVDLDSHRNIVMSLNIVGTHLADHADDQEKAEALRSRLEKTNIRWEAVCQAAAQWQTQLQHALMENQGFHRIIEELMEWLENTEDTIRLAEPVDLTEESNVVEAKYNKFRELHEELERCEPRVMSLQDAADQLLRQSDAPENSVLTRLTSLRLRLQSLRRITGIYVLKLGAVLGHDPSELGLVASHRTGSGQNVGASLVSLSQELLEQAAAASSIHTETRHSNDNGTAREDEVDTTVLTRGYQFFGRVLRASLPIQALMLLILGVASLVPSREEDYSCILSNNLANSFEPLLFYPNGPPPV